MRQWINRLPAIAMAIAVVVGAAAALGAAAAGLSLPGTGAGIYGLERADGKYYTIIDEHNKPLDYTAHILYPGDEFITADNLRYQITGIRGDIASTRLVGKEAAVTVNSFLPATGGTSRKVAAGKQEIAIYHTHSDESYDPSDGTSSIYAHGGVFQVGDAFAAKLKGEGFKVMHSLRPHDPHDANAYVRSRRTAAELLKTGPAAMFDLHRDAAPANVYSATVDGQPITKVRFVLGRGNPHISANLQFAKEIKAAEDQLHPGVVQGILLTQGNFNQDLTPRSLLIEVGANTNAKDAAERGVSFFSDAIPKVLGGVTTGARPNVEFPVTGTNRADWNAALWIALIAAGALAGYLYINAGSWQGVWDQVRRFLGGEFGNRIKDRR